MTLPKGVEKVTARGRTYYYWNPDRGTAREGQRVRLPNAETEPASFWKEIELYRPKAKPAPRGSVGFLVQSYRRSEDFKKLSDSTKASYGVHLSRFEAAWGKLSFDLADGAVIALRDALAGTPGMANHMLSVGQFAVELGSLDWRAVRSVSWRRQSERCRRRIMSHGRHGPSTLFAGQPGRTSFAWCGSGWRPASKRSDLIRMAPAKRERHGLWCRPEKAKKKRKAFYIPLTPADERMLDRWPATKIAFTASRWKAPIRRGNADYYLFSPRGVPYTETSLRARWHRWLKTDDGKVVCERWQAWVAEMVRKYEWEIDPEEMTYPTIHGLRGAGILIRRAAGHDVDQIANDIGMSRQMVERYMRFRDQMQVAATGQARLKLIKR